MQVLCKTVLHFCTVNNDYRGDYMQKVSGWTVFTKEEMNNDNVKTVITEMIQNNRDQMTHWNIGCGMYKLLECQNNALLKVLESISQTEI